MDLGIGVEPVDQRAQFALAGVGGQVVVEGMDADLLAGLALVAHVHRRSRIVADQHDGQARARLARRHPRLDADGEVVEQRVGDALAVEDAGAHDFCRLSPMPALPRHMNDVTDLEAAAFRRLLRHLDERKDVQNIDLMTSPASAATALPTGTAKRPKPRAARMDKDAAREAIYGMPFAEWKARIQPEATPEQLAAFEAARQGARLNTKTPACAGDGVSCGCGSGLRDAGAAPPSWRARGFGGRLRDAELGQHRGQLLLRLRLCALAARSSGPWPGLCWPRAMRPAPGRPGIGDGEATRPGRPWRKAAWPACGPGTPRRCRRGAGPAAGTGWRGARPAGLRLAGHGKPRIGGGWAGPWPGVSRSSVARAQWSFHTSV